MTTRWVTSRAVSSLPPVRVDHTPPLVEMNDIREPRLTLCNGILPKPTRLADLLREFSIPRLEDKPQNPIVCSLERTRIQPLPRLTVDEHRSSLPSLDSKSEKKKSENEDIWIQVKDIGLERKVSVLDSNNNNRTELYPGLPGLLGHAQRCVPLVGHILSICLGTGTTRLRSSSKSFPLARIYFREKS